jgi:APA family basic amino acid/polyamine antiporter
VLRRDPGETDHFRTPVVLPVLGIASCVLLATQIEAAVWLRGLTIVAVGAVLAAISVARRSRRTDEGEEKRAEADASRPG